MSIDNNGLITSINPAAERMTGSTEEKAIGQFISSVVTNLGLLEVLKKGEPYSEKYQVGKRKYISNRSPIIRNGKVVGAVGVFQDISEIEFISAELSSVENILNEKNIVLESSNDAILITDYQGEIIQANQAFLRILGLGSIPESYNSLVGDYFDTSIVSTVLENQQLITVMERNKKNQNLLMVTGTPVTTTEGKIDRIVINLRNITEIDHLRRELAPFSFFTAISSEPPLVCISIGSHKDRKKDTLVNIETTKEFVINSVSEEWVEQMDQTGTPFEASVNEFEQVGLTPEASLIIKPPRVKEAKVSMECKLYELLALGADFTLVIGQVVNFHIAKEVYLPDYKIDHTQLKAVGRLAGSYARTTDNFPVKRR